MVVFATEVHKLNPGGAVVAFPVGCDRGVLGSSQHTQPAPAV